MRCSLRTCLRRLVVLTWFAKRAILGLTGPNQQDNDIRSAISSPRSIDASSQRPFDTCEFDGLISDPMPASYCRSPSRKQATQLWQVYLNNADPLLKLLHIPSVNSLVFAAINNPEEVTAGTSALLFAIDFAAVTSLPSPDTILLLNQDRPSALNQFQRGLEISLHAAVFLDSPTITTLQAMTIYLVTFPLTCLAVYAILPLSRDVVEVILVAVRVGLSMASSSAAPSRLGFIETRNILSSRR